MIRKSLWWTSGTAALVLAGCLAFAAIDLRAPAAATSRPNETCAETPGSLQQLATIDNADDGSYQCLGLTFKGDAVEAIRLETHRVASAAGYPQADVKIAEFPVAVVESSHGAVLDGVPGHDAIILQGHFSTPPQTADLVTSFLYNGFTGEYRSCHITLGRVPDDGWRLVNQLDQTISHVLVATRRIPLFGTFGIANLEGACSSAEQ